MIARSGATCLDAEVPAFASMTSYELLHGVYPEQKVGFLSDCFTRRFAMTERDHQRIFGIYYKKRRDNEREG